MWERVISQYAGISLLQVKQLDIIDYLILKRDAYIFTLSKTEEGRKALNEAWYFEQTEPDFETLYQEFGV